MISDVAIIPLIVGLVNPTNAAWDCRIVHLNWQRETEFLYSIQLNVPEQFRTWYPYHKECLNMGYDYTGEYKFSGP